VYYVTLLGRYQCELLEKKREKKIQREDGRTPN